MQQSKLQFVVGTDWCKVIEVNNQLVKMKTSWDFFDVYFNVPCGTMFNILIGYGNADDWNKEFNKRIDGWLRIEQYKEKTNSFIES